MVNIEIDIKKRLEKGLEHHPESIKIFKTICDIDYYLNNDFLGFKMGTSNSEHMLYLLDIYFESKDKRINLPIIIKELKSVFETKINYIIYFTNRKAPSFRSVM